MITPPKLRNDCFALPAGVDWVPLDEALERLRERVSPVVESETVPLDMACGRILSRDVIALRANPPAPNSAVDGYGFCGPIPEGAIELPLIEGRAAAGEAFVGNVPEGQAIRILTGAILPEGVDTVVLQEDVAREGRAIAFNGPLKAGANTRNAGEDMNPGDIVLRAGQRVRPPDIAPLAATGIGQIEVFGRLRVGVLSSGDEVVAPGATPTDLGVDKIFDANRPMLLAQLTQWGFDAVDLGIAPDDREALRTLLDGARDRVDAILTSGGVSTGDEDHVSALLRTEGSLDTWRIAIKPGRPLALGLWDGVPVFGLPGNPVAAFVCTLVFARPALETLSGGHWTRPEGMMLPAAFEKNKKPGRAEFLRARLSANGHVEVFPSEGSGRTSGLSWASGLVELREQAQRITPGDLVRFIPYGSFD